VQSDLSRDAGDANVTAGARRMHGGVQIADTDIATRSPKINRVITRHLDGKSDVVSREEDEMEPVVHFAVINMSRNRYTGGSLLGMNVNAVQEGLRAGQLRANGDIAGLSADDVHRADLSVEGQSPPVWGAELLGVGPVRGERDGRGEDRGDEYHHGEDRSGHGGLPR
jgi:hypothetical protein